MNILSSSGHVRTGLPAQPAPHEALLRLIVTSVKRALLPPTLLIPPEADAVTTKPSSTALESTPPAVTTLVLLAPWTPPGALTTPLAFTVSLLSMSPLSTVRLAAGMRWPSAVSVPAKPP